MRKIPIIAALLGMLAAPALAQSPQPTQNKPRFELGYNALEAGPTADPSNVHTRLLSNIDLNVGPAQLGYSGLNEIDDFNPDSYFARHVLTAGRGSTKGAVIIKNTNKDVLGHFYGIRNTSLPKLLGGYGFLDIGANKDAANATIFYGLPIGKASLEFYVDGTFPYSGRREFHNELQLNIPINSYLSGFARGETTTGMDSKALAGIAVKIR